MRKGAPMKGKTTVILSAAMLVASLVGYGSISHAGAQEGKKLFEAEKCASCHQIQGPAREKTIQDQLAKKGPELWYAGSKFKREFLVSWLADPRPIRPLEYYSLTKKNTGNHPKLSPRQASDMTEFLMGLRSPDVKALGIQPADNPRGRVVFIKKQSCYGCHEVIVRGNAAGGLSGPSFAGAGKRLQADWIYAYLSNPKAFKPVKDMPDYTGYIKDDEMRDLAAYVGSLN